MDLINKTVENQNDKEQMTPIIRKSMLKRTPPASPAGSVTISDPKKPPPRMSIAATLEEERGDASSLEYATRLVNALSEFVAPKNNVHSEVKLLVTKIQKAMLELNKERKVREESTQKKVATLERFWTPRSNSKRPRHSPESTSPTPTPKAARKGFRRVGGDEERPWEFVGRKKKKKPTEPKPVQKPQPREARKVRPKSDALLIDAKDKNSYAEILRKVKSDPNLKELGTQVARIRRTRNGEMLFELKGDTLVKSGIYKGLIEKSLGDDATVRALTQELVVEVCNLDEITTEEELREELIKQFSLGEIGRTAKVKLRKAYSGTQIATIKLPVTEANKLLEKGKIKVGWTICQLRTPRTQLLRCYKCLGFGHVAKLCTLTDRSKRCWRCGEEGHVSTTCTNKPKCMLCQQSESNDHATGSLKCKAYKEAKACQGWR